MRRHFSLLVLGVAMFVSAIVAHGSTTVQVPTVEILSASLSPTSVAPAISEITPASSTSTPIGPTTSATPLINPACSAASFAFADENPESQDLASRIDLALEHQGFGGHGVSVSVWVEGWGEIATHNPDLRLHPASNQKVLTAIGANAVLDPAASLTTRIELLGNDLVIRAGGDPTLTFPRLLEAIDSALARIGTSIDRIILDVTEYPQVPAADGWLERHTPAYVGPLSGLMLNNNRWTADELLIRNPEQANGERIAFFLRERGVEVGSVFVARLAKPAAGTTIATIESEPIASIVETMLRTSDNAKADLLLMQTGRVSSGEGSLASGAEAIESVLWENCGSLDGLIDDGSGLSRENWRSARSLVRSMVAIHGTPEGELLRSQMPVGGVSGTLAGRFGGANAGLVQAKTGTLFTARALSGWARMADGRDAIFSVIVNGEEGTMGSAIPAIDALVKEIVRIPAPPVEPVEESTAPTPLEPVEESTTKTPLDPLEESIENGLLRTLGNAPSE